MENNLDTIRNFSLMNILSICKLHKIFIILFVSISILLTGVYSLIMPQQFSAIATVLPPEENQGGGGLSSFLQSISGGISLGGLAKGTKIELYLEMLQSRAVAKHIVKKCNLEHYKNFQFQNKDILYDVVGNLLDVEANRSGLMIVNATISTPYFPNQKDKISAAKLSASIANAAVEGLDLINRHNKNFKAQKKKDFISGVLNQNLKKLDSIDIEIEKFQKTNKILALDEQTQAILDNAVAIGAELSKAEVQLGIANQEYKAQSPRLKAYQQKVANLKNQYDKVQLGGLTTTDKFSIPLTNVPKLIRIYTNLLRDQKILTQVILYLQTQKFQEAIQAESNIPTVLALDKAFPPYKRSSPSRVLMLAIGFLLSSFIAISFVIIRAFKKGNLSFDEHDK